MNRFATARAMLLWSTLLAPLLTGCSSEPTVKTSELQGIDEACSKMGFVDTALGLTQVNYQAVDSHNALVEGDMLFPLRDIRDHADTDLALAFGHRKTLWTNATVYYELDASLTVPLRQAFLAGAAEWQAATGVKWVERHGQANYVAVLLDNNISGGWATVGMRGGRQETRLSAYCSPGCVKHEMGHTLGLSHEHSRPDRDQYLLIHSENMAADAVASLQIAPDSNVEMLTPFDMQSIMLYYSFAFSNNRQPVLTALDGSLLPFVSVISPGDALGVKKLYGLDGKAAGTTITVPIKNANAEGQRGSPTAAESATPQEDSKGSSGSCLRAPSYRVMPMGF